ncbi:MAG: Gldg family protein [Myxococcales bacterium]|nr:Gldg family protein [Myxococcales bacterium]MCB9580877.1 Gldg family protein [Polyangiaceae bacterium]
MAVKDEKQPAAAPPPERKPVMAPLWTVPLYVAGLVFVFIGERVLASLPTAHWVVTLIGLLSVVGATVVRFSPRFRVGGERRDIEKLLAILSLTGVIALGIYFATTEWGQTKLGLAAMDPEARERWQGILTILWVSLVAVSVVPMLFAEAALLPMRRAPLPESRRVRAAVVSGFSLVLAAVYGALFVYAATGADVKADYSYFKTSEPSESTKKVAQALTEPVDVIAFFPEVNEIKPEVERYLRGVSAGNPNLKVEVQDRLLIPKRARELRATQDGVIVLSRGSVTESLSIGTDERTARPKLKTLDRDFQEKLLKLLRSRRTAYLTVGHGELNDKTPGATEGSGVRILRTLLQKQNYLVKDLGLTQGLGSDVPDDASIVMVLGPSEPFAPEELGALERYAKRGGKLFMALDPEAVREGEGAGAPATGESAAPPTSAAPPASAAPATSGEAPPAAPPSKNASALEALAAVVGLRFSPVVLANENQHVRRRFNDSDRTLLFSNRFSSHASVSTLSRASARAAVVVFGAGSLDRAAGTTNKVDFAVRSMAGTFADANKNYRIDAGESPSSFNIAAAVSAKAVTPPKKKPEPKDKKDQKKDDAADETRAFVLADADALTDVVMANVLGNQVLLLDAVRWLGGEESFAGEVNSEEDVSIEHTKEKDLVWFYGTIFGAPALVLALGLTFARRSRKRGGRA